MSEHRRWQTVGHHVGHHWKRGRPVYLMIALFLFLLAHPAFGQSTWGEILLNGMFSLVLFSALWALKGKRWLLITASVFCAPWVVLAWVGSVFEMDNKWLDVIALSSFSAFNLLLVGAMVEAILLDMEVTVDTLCRAVSAYLLLGITWMGLYALLLQLDPQALSSSPGLLADGTFGGNDLLYFSFTTLTTLGYGDILPNSPIARSLVIMESVLGPLYLSILIAHLVALYGHSLTTRRKGN